MKVEKKPLYKRWWFIVIVVMLFIGVMANLTDSDDEEVESNDSEEVDKGGKSEKNEPIKEVSVLNNKEVELIKSNLEDSLEADRELGDMFYLDDYDYDPEENKILVRIDMQQDPLPENKEEIEEWSETWAWSIVETNEVEEDYDVRVSLVSKVDDGYIVWGRTNYDSSSGKYKFKQDDGMKLYD